MKKLKLFASDLSLITLKVILLIVALEFYQDEI